MTMPFALAGEPVLDYLEVGDALEGRLEVTESQSRLVDVFITQQAEPIDRAPEPERAPEQEQRLVLEPGAAVPDFAMTTQDGKPLVLSQCKGHVVVLTFIYTRCPLPDFCPLLDRKFSDLSRALRVRGGAASGVRLLSISFDPEHDTPAVLAEHARRLGARPPRWTFAVASHEELDRVAEPLGLSVSARPDELVHTLSTAIVSPDGRLLALFRGNQWSSEDVLALVLENSGVRESPPKPERGPAQSTEN
jgi:protein SCO1/2